jgi:hypothetical protein
VFAREARTNSVKGAGPRESIGHNTGLVTHGLSRDPFNPLCHFGCRTTRKCHEQDLPRIGAVYDQMCDL